jgi:hypothetical protein
MIFRSAVVVLLSVVFRPLEAGAQPPRQFRTLAHLIAATVSPERGNRSIFVIDRDSMLRVLDAFVGSRERAEIKEFAMHSPRFVRSAAHSGQGRAEARDTTVIVVAGWRADSDSTGTVVFSFLKQNPPSRENCQVSVRRVSRHAWVAVSRAGDDAAYTCFSF